MKQLIYKGIAIFSIVILIDLFVGAISDRVFTSLPDKNSLIATIQHSLFNKNADILILGPSTAVHNYNTIMLSDSLKAEVYNAGIDGHEMIYSDIIFQAFVDRCNLQTVIIDIYESQLNGQWMVSLNDLNPYYRLNKNVTRYFEEETGWEQKLKLSSSLYRYNKTISYLFRVAIDKPNTLKGYIPLEGSLKDIEHTEIKGFNVNLKECHHLQKIVKICKGRGIEIFLVLSPSRYRNTDFVDWISSFCKKNKIKFIDFNSKSKYYSHPEWFRDDTHLNAIGADIFTKDLIIALKGE